MPNGHNERAAKIAQLMEMKNGDGIYTVDGPLFKYMTNRMRPYRFMAVALFVMYLIFEWTVITASVPILVLTLVSAVMLYFVIGAIVGFITISTTPIKVLDDEINFLRSKGSILKSPSPKKDVDVSVEFQQQMEIFANEEVQLASRRAALERAKSIADRFPKSDTGEPYKYHLMRVSNNLKTTSSKCGEFTYHIPDGVLTFSFEDEKFHTFELLIAEDAIENISEKENISVSVPVKAVHNADSSEELFFEIAMIYISQEE